MCEPINAHFTNSQRRINRPLSNQPTCNVPTILVIFPATPAHESQSKVMKSKAKRNLVQYTQPPTQNNPVNNAGQRAGWLVYYKQYYGFFVFLLKWRLFFVRLIGWSMNCCGGNMSQGGDEEMRRSEEGRGQEGRTGKERRGEMREESPRFRSLLR